jgi:hypothetical protein
MRIRNVGNVRLRNALGKVIARGLQNRSCTDTYDETKEDGSFKIHCLNECDR